MIQETRRISQQPAFPWEITDAIIDFLHDDTKSLSACSGVCSEWLIRSRFHGFSTIRLWPWRVGRFFQLANSPHCTFTKVISRLELDNSPNKTQERESRSGDGITGKDGDEGSNIRFSDALPQSHIQCLAHVNSILFRKVDWTTFPHSEKVLLRERLVGFSQLRRLEFDDVIFHDLRDVARIANLFPALNHLTANVTFTKYIEHAVASKALFEPSTRLCTIEIGADDAIPVILNGIPDGCASNVVGLKLLNIKSNDLQYIHATLKKARNGLQDLFLGFAKETISLMAEDNVLVSVLDLSNLRELRSFTIGGLQLTTSRSASLVDKTLPELLRRINSPFLESLELKFRLEDDMALSAADWSTLQAIMLELHFFGMKFVCVVLEIGSRSSRKESDVQRRLSQIMPDLYERGALKLRVIRDQHLQVEFGCKNDSEDSEDSEEIQSSACI